MGGFREKSTEREKSIFLMSSSSTVDGPHQPAPDSSPDAVSLQDVLNQIKELRETFRHDLRTTVRPLDFVFIIGFLVIFYLIWSLRFEVKNLRSTVEDLRSTVDRLPAILSRARSIARARATSTAIIVRNSSNHHLDGSSGNVIQIERECFVSSTAHGLHLNETDINYFISMEEIPQLNQTGRVLFSEKEDAALLPIVCPAGVTPLELSGDLIAVGQQMSGIALRKLRAVLLSCRVQEEWEDHDWQADCGGTSGFSGTGLLDLNGNLLALHQGAGHYPHSESGSGWLDEHWNSTVENCSVTTLPLPANCFAGLRSAIKETSRNPRSNLVEAVMLRKIWEKRKLKRHSHSKSEL
jgi:hypothetical protein